MKARVNQLSHSLERARGSGENPNSAKHLQDKFAARKSKSTCHECGQRGHWSGDPQCTATRDTNFTTWTVLPDREDYRAIMMVERIEQFGVFVSTLSRICNNFMSVRTSQLWQVIIPITYLLSLTLFFLHLQLNLGRLFDL